MTPTDVHAVLSYASALDPRVRRNDPDERQLQAAAWYAQLARVDVAEAKAAVDAHYASPTADAVMPAHIRALSSAARHPAYKTFAEAMESAEHGPGDLVVERARVARLTAQGVPADDFDDFLKDA